MSVPTFLSTDSTPWISFHLRVRSPPLTCSAPGGANSYHLFNRRHHLCLLLLLLLLLPFPSIVLVLGIVPLADIRGNQQQHAKPGFSGSNPFDSVPDSDRFGDSKDKGSGTTSPQVLHSGFSTAKARYKNDFRDSGGIENQSVQELQNYSAYKAEETTIKLNGCLKIAEEIREGASNTLVTLHQQGEQITRTHQAVADIEPDLSRGEKLLGSLGGLFSKKWKPKKTHKIKGPLSIKDDSSERSRHLEQRQRLGLAAPLPRSEPQHFSEPASALQKVEIEKAKQDDVLSDLSNLLGELKNMAIDMGSEFEKQNVALDRAQDDVDEMNTRVHGANLPPAARPTTLLHHRLSPHLITSSKPSPPNSSSNPNPNPVPFLTPINPYSNPTKPHPHFIPFSKITNMVVLTTSTILLLSSSISIKLILSFIRSSAVFPPSSPLSPISPPPLHLRLLLLQTINKEDQ
ncbi:unnamed protein product [Musa banksii]